MLLKPLIFAAAGLSAVTAFLVPAEITQAHGDAVSSLPFDMALFAEKQSLDLDCPGCPLQLRGRQGSRQGITNHLEMTFTIEHLPTHDRLLLNDFELYPHSDPLRSSLSAPQIPDFDDETTGQRVPKAPKFLDVVAPELGFGLQWQPVAEEVETGMRLVSLDFQVIEVGNAFVNGIPNIRVKLLQSPDGALMISNIETTESQTAQSNPMEPQEECTSLFCKWEAIIAQQFQRMRAHKCGMRAHRMDKEHHHGHHHHEQQRPGQIQLHEHSWKQLFKYLGSHILFPVLAGIAAGVSVSIIGMVLCTILVGAWRVLVRGQPFFHRRRHHSGRQHKAAQREAFVAEEKAGLMADQE